MARAETNEEHIRRRSVTSERQRGTRQEAAALWVGALSGSDFVARRSQIHGRICSLLAPRHNPKDSPNAVRADL